MRSAVDLLAEGLVGGHHPLLVGIGAPNVPGQFAGLEVEKIRVHVQGFGEPLDQEFRGRVPAIVLDVVEVLRRNGPPVLLEDAVGVLLLAEACLLS